MAMNKFFACRGLAGAGAGAAGGRVRRRDVGVGAVVEVEEGGLGALEEDVCSGGEFIVEEVDGVGQVRTEAFAEGAELGDDGVDIERVAAGFGNDDVLGLATGAVGGDLGGLAGGLRRGSYIVFGRRAGGQREAGKGKAWQCHGTGGSREMAKHEKKTLCLAQCPADLMRWVQE